MPLCLALRARICLLAQEGLSKGQIAKALKTSSPTGTVVEEPVCDWWPLGPGAGRAPRTKPSTHRSEVGERHWERHAANVPTGRDPRGEPRRGNARLEAGCSACQPTKTRAAWVWARKSALRGCNRQSEGPCSGFGTRSECKPVAVLSGYQVVVVLSGGGRNRAG